MVNTITRDFGYIAVEFRDDWGVRTRELTAFCTQCECCCQFHLTCAFLCVPNRVRDLTSALLNMGVL